MKVVDGLVGCDGTLCAPGGFLFEKSFFGEQVPVLFKVRRWKSFVLSSFAAARPVLLPRNLTVTFLDLGSTSFECRPAESGSLVEEVLCRVLHFIHVNTASVSIENPVVAHEEAH